MRTETWGIYLYPMLDDSKAVHVGSVEAEIREIGVEWNVTEIHQAVAELAPRHFDAVEPIKCHKEAHGGLHTGTINGEDYDLRAWWFDPSTKMGSPGRFAHGGGGGSCAFDPDYDHTYERGIYE